MSLKLISLLLFASVVFAADPPPTPQVAAAPARARRAARPEHHGNAGEFLSDAMTKSAECKMDGALPDAACTPGAVMGITEEEVCTTSTKGRRAVTTAMRKQVYAEYGVSFPQPSGTFEVDHFIPLELGGSNDISNLWPQPANPEPGFHQKDCVENFLHAQVCKAKAISLSEAQRQIAHDWLSVFATAKDSHTPGCPGK